MASTYIRDSSPFIHIQFKDTAGKWRCKKTGYRKDNLGDRKQAERLAERMSSEERIQFADVKSEAFDVWVEPWLRKQYEPRKNQTLDSFLRRWIVTGRWLRDNKLTTPAMLRYPHMLQYREDRLEDGASINTIVMEAKLLRIVMKEAVRREFAQVNPCAELGWKRVAAKEKEEWSDANFLIVREALDAKAPTGWMMVTLLLGFYQAARLRQCEVPLAAINLGTARISYWRTIDGRPLTKGDKPFTQPIDHRIIPALRRIIDARIAEGKSTLCDLPELPSLEWRALLDKLGLPNLCHHGLRVTWATRAARSGKVPEPQARRFVNHGSEVVHRIYQKLNADDVAHIPAALDLPA